MTGPALDPDTLAQLASDMAPEDLRYVCQLLVQDARAMLAAMEQAQAAGDQAAWQRAAHRLAGGASGVGARPLEAAAREMMEQSPSAEALIRITALVESTTTALNEIGA